MIAAVPQSELVDVELTPDGRHLLRSGLLEWGGLLRRQMNSPVPWASSAWPIS
jgi:hypothetical protein